MLRGGGEERGEPRRRADGQVEVRIDVAPRWPFALPTAGSADGLLRRRGAGLQRLLHREGEPVLVGAVQPGPGCVRFGARGPSASAARWGIARLRFALGVDDDLAPFHRAFRDDPYVGRTLRAHPTLRPQRRPEPWEALCAAICEQLVEFDRAVAIQRRIIGAHGRRCPATGLRDAPSAATVADLAPARLASYDLVERRGLALRRAAREVAAGRVDLHAPDHEAGWRRLRAIPGIGSWTLEMLGFLGQGRHDQLAALDVGYLKLVGRIVTGNPRARADEAEVRGFFARYGAWQGLAGEYLRRAAATGRLPAPEVSRSARAPRPAGTRSSAPGPSSARP